MAEERRAEARSLRAKAKTHERPRLLRPWLLQARVKHLTFADLRKSCVIVCNLARTSEARICPLTSAKVGGDGPAVFNLDHMPAELTLHRIGNLPLSSVNATSSKASPSDRRE